MEYCGYAVWNVHTKAGRERPPEDWVIAERGHEALITEKEARRIAEARCDCNGLPASGGQAASAGWPSGAQATSAHSGWGSEMMPQELEVSISYRLPEAIMNGLVAGGGFEPPTFGL
jgi:hypothetical protein